MVKVIVNIKKGMVQHVASSEPIEYYIKDEDADPEEWLIKWEPDYVSEDIVTELEEEVREKSTR